MHIVMSLMGAPHILPHIEVKLTGEISSGENNTLQRFELLQKKALYKYLLLLLLSIYDVHSKRFKVSRVRKNL